MSKIKKNRYLDETPLDDYERELKEFIDKGEFVRVENYEETRKMFQEAAKNYKELQKTKRISLRVKNEDILKVKAKAKRANMVADNG